MANRSAWVWASVSCVAVFAACSSGSGQAGGAGGSGQGGSNNQGVGGSTPIQPPKASCAPGANPQNLVAEPELIAELSDRWHEAWLASPAVVDLDGDGQVEIISARHGLVLGWHIDGTQVFRAEVEGRSWASPVVADLRPDLPGLELAQASSDKIYAWQSNGELLPGFPFAFRGELRSLAAGDIDGDGQLELVSVTTQNLSANGQRDIVMAIKSNGQVAPGFPPNTSGASGCDDACYVYNGYDQNIALGDVNGDGISDIFATQDNAYNSLHEGDGRAFDCDPSFRDKTKFQGVRGLHDANEARQGYANDEETALQAHHTNTAPAIVDIDGDGKAELVYLASVQNAAQSRRELGVALWALKPDGTRPAGWETPLHFPDYLSGLWDYEDNQGNGTNIVAITNQVTVADLDPERPGQEFVFAGFDGKIHAVDSQQNLMFSVSYTTHPQTGTGGVLVADLNQDGSPEIIFATYSTEANRSHLFILDSGGNLLHQLPLPGRGAMPVPTIADADGDGSLDIVVSLKGGEDRQAQVLVYRVPGSADDCLLWPTGRGNYLRDGYIVSEAP